MLDALAELYASLPALACQQRCQAVCGPIAGTPVEYRRIMHRHRRALGAGHTATQCGCLTDAGACAIYADRPLICRLVGLTEATACPHGCVPERWLTEEQAYQAMRAVFRMRA